MRVRATAVIDIMETSIAGFLHECGDVIYAKLYRIRVVVSRVCPSGRIVRVFFCEF